MPKPMLLLQERPLLEYIIRNLASHGFDQIAINLHFLPEVILDYFGDGSRWNVSITYSYEPELLGTAGGVKKMQHFLEEGDAFLVHYGDIITDQNLTSMLEYHIDKAALSTLLLHQRKNSNSIVSINEEGRITGFIERPNDRERNNIDSLWVNSGIYICDPEFLSLIPTGIANDLPRDIFAKNLKECCLYGFPLTGYRCAIDSPQRLDDAISALKEKRINI